MTALSITPHYSRIFYQEQLAHFDKALIPLNHWWQASQLEMQDGVYVIHRPLFRVTFHLSCYIGVRDLPPALSLCAVLMSWESWQVFFLNVVMALPVSPCWARQHGPAQKSVPGLSVKYFCIVCMNLKKTPMLHILCEIKMWGLKLSFHTKYHAAFPVKSKYKPIF